MIKAQPVAICEEHGKVGCALCKRAVAEDVKNAGQSEEEATINYFTNVDLGNVPDDTIVVFDSATQLTTSAINNITKAQPDDYKLQTDDWGYLAKLMELFLATIQQATYNCIVISHEIEAETEGKKKTLVPVAGSRNSSRNSAKAFDEVVYLERKNMKHKAYSASTHSNTILTGSRTDTRLEDDEVATLLRIFKPDVLPDSSKQPATGSSILKNLQKKTT